MMGKSSQETDGELPLMTELTTEGTPFRSWGLMRYPGTTNFPASNSNNSAPQSPVPYDKVPTIDSLPATTNRGEGGEEVDPSNNKQLQKSNPTNGEEPQHGLQFRTAGAAKNLSADYTYGRTEEHDTQQLQKGFDNGRSTKTQSIHTAVEFEEEERSESTAGVTEASDHRRLQSLHVDDDERLRRDLEKLGIFGSSDGGSRHEPAADHDHEMPSVLQNWRQDYARNVDGRQWVHHHREINRQADNHHDFGSLFLKKGRQRIDSAAAEPALSPLFLNPNHPPHNYGVHYGVHPFALEEPSVTEDDDDEEEESSSRSFSASEHARADRRRHYYNYGSCLSPPDDRNHALIRNDSTMGANNENYWTENRERDHRPFHMNDLQTSELQPIHSGGFFDYEFEFEFDHQQQQPPHRIRTESVSAPVAATGSMVAKESPNHHRSLQQQQTPPKPQTSRITKNPMMNIMRQPMLGSPRRRWVNESVEQNRLMEGAAAAEPLALLTELEDYGGSRSSNIEDYYRGGCSSSINEEDARDDAVRSALIVDHAAAGREYQHPRRHGSGNNMNRKLVSGDHNSDPLPKNVDGVRRDEAGGGDHDSKQGRTIDVLSKASNGRHNDRHREQHKTPDHVLQLAAVESGSGIRRSRAGDEYAAAGSGSSSRELVVSKMECNLDGDQQLAMEPAQNNNGEVAPRSLSQKYRPRRFREMVGQHIVTEALASSVARQKIAPVYLFHGPKGTGKTTAARIFCAALRCRSSSRKSNDSGGRHGRVNIGGGEAEEEGEPCGRCEECRAVAAGRSEGVKEVEAASYDGIEKVKALMDGLMMPPSSKASGGGRICLRTAEEEERRQTSSCYKVLVIDQCEALSPETWTALLPVMEEPPPGMVMLLVTTADAGRLPPTVTSRCHRFPFLKLSPTQIAARLRSLAAAERIPFLDSHTIHLIAARSDGSLRDAQTTLHLLTTAGSARCPAFYHLLGCASDERMVSLLDSALQGDVVATVRKARDLLQDSGVEPLSLTTQLATLILDILASPPAQSFPFSVDDAHKLLQRSSSSNRRTGFFTNQTLTGEKLERLRKAMTTLSQAEKQLRHSNDRATWLTAALLQLGPPVHSVHDDVRHSSNLQPPPHHALPPTTTTTTHIPVVQMQDQNVAPPPMTDPSFHRQLQQKPTPASSSSFDSSRYEQAWLEHYYDPCISQHLRPPPYKHIVRDNPDGRQKSKTTNYNNVNEVGGDTVAELQNVWRAVIEKCRSQQPKLREFLTTATIKLASISLSEDDAVVHLEASNAHQRDTCDRSKEIIAALFEAVLGFPVGVIVTTTTATLQQQQQPTNSSKISPPYVSSTSSSEDTAEGDPQGLAAGPPRWCINYNHGTFADSVRHRMIVRIPATEAERGDNVDRRKPPPPPPSSEPIIAGVDRARRSRNNDTKEMHQMLPELHRSRILQGAAPEFEAAAVAASKPTLTVRQAMMQKEPPPQPPRHFRSGTNYSLYRRSSSRLTSMTSFPSPDQHRDVEDFNYRIRRSGASPIKISTMAAGQQMKTPPRSEDGFISSPAAPQHKNKSTVIGALAQLFRLKKLQGNKNRCP